MDLLLNISREFFFNLIISEFPSCDCPDIVLNSNQIVEKQVEILQQDNGFDCGIFMLQFIEMFSAVPFNECDGDMTEWFDESLVKNKRKDLINLIKKKENDEMQKEKEKQIQFEKEKAMQIENETQKKNE